MRPIAVTCGIFIIICGVIATVTGEFGSFGPWFLALGFACAGVAGLGSILFAGRSEAEETAPI